MVDYLSVANKCKTGLAKAGVTMTLRQVVAGTYDPVTGTYSGGSTTDYEVMALVQSGSATGQRFFNNVLVQTDDQMVLLAASGLAIAPAPGDLLIMDGVSHTIVSVIPIQPGLVPLLYRILARK